MRVAIGLVVAAAACVLAALFVAAAGEASVPGANGKIASTSDPAAVAVAGTDPPAWTTARRDQVVVRDDGVLELFALDGMLLYGRTENLDNSAPPTARRWMRVVNGRQLQVQGVPAASGPFSIGRDATGRVVAVLGQYSSGEVFSGGCMTSRGMPHARCASLRRKVVPSRRWPSGVAALRTPFAALGSTTSGVSSFAKPPARRASRNGAGA